MFVKCKFIKYKKKNENVPDKITLKKTKKKKIMKFQTVRSNRFIYKNKTFQEHINCNSTKSITFLS